MPDRPQKGDRVWSYSRSKQAPKLAANGIIVYVKLYGDNDTIMVSWLGTYPWNLNESELFTLDQFEGNYQERLGGYWYLD